jgi:hypothetical protein
MMRLARCRICIDSHASLATGGSRILPPLGVGTLVVSDDVNN